MNSLINSGWKSPEMEMRGMGDIMFVGKSVDRNRYPFKSGLGYRACPGKCVSLSTGRKCGSDCCTLIDIH
jgi:hypothetical protein